MNTDLITILTLCVLLISRLSQDLTSCTASVTLSNICLMLCEVNVNLPNASAENSLNIFLYGNSLFSYSQTSLSQVYQ